MHKYAVGLVCLVLGCAAGSALPTLTAQSGAPHPSVQRWEHTCDFDVRTATSRQQRNMLSSMAQHGQQGWELVTLSPGGSPCFKRPLVR
jgi:hypothetical protein